jgi:hypothetical protein
MQRMPNASVVEAMRQDALAKREASIRAGQEPCPFAMLPFEAIKHANPLATMMQMIQEVDEVNDCLVGGRGRARGRMSSRTTSKLIASLDVLAKLIDPLLAVDTAAVQVHVATAAYGSHATAPTSCHCARECTEDRLLFLDHRPLPRMCTLRLARRWRPG